MIAPVGFLLVDCSVDNIIFVLQVYLPDVMEVVKKVSQLIQLLKHSNAANYHGILEPLFDRLDVKESLRFPCFQVDIEHYKGTDLYHELNMT